MKPPSCGNAIGIMRQRNGKTFLKSIAVSIFLRNFASSSGVTFCIPTCDTYTGITTDKTQDWGEACSTDIIHTTRKKTQASQKLYTMKKILLFFCMLMTAVSGFAEYKDSLGIYNKTFINNTYWRYDFRYESKDIAGKPIVLSAAIFINKKLAEKEQDGKGCILLNHFTITDNADRPTNVHELQKLEGTLQSMKYFIIESDGIGFGNTVHLPQPYLQGRVLGMADIDAFLAGRKILTEEGFKFDDVVLNMGYSQGGYVGTWVDRLVSEGYRHDELPKIHYSFLGAGSYDIYATYLDIIKETVTHYPVALPLVLWDIVNDSTTGVKYEDVLTKSYLDKISEWFDDKTHNTDSINAMAFRLYNTTEDKGISTNLLFTEQLWDPQSDIVQNHIKPWMIEHSTPYGDWAPWNTDTITFVQSRTDEVVASVNAYSISEFYKKQGYTHFDVDSTFTGKHTPVGTNYVMKAVQLFSKWKPKDSTTGITQKTVSTPASKDVYSIDGRMVLKAKDYNRGFASLPKGVYIAAGRKVVKGE